MRFCVTPADILLPDTDLNKFACIACDQYTSEKEYWEELKKYTRGCYTSLELILPEAYLKEDNSGEIENIKGNMLRYLKQGVFKEIKNSLVYVERNTPYTPLRRGLVAAVDLEQYSYSGAKTPIRSSEGTVLSRIPPRAQIRKGAALEMPHILLLIDDKSGDVFNTINKQKNKPLLYDAELNFNGGHIKGWKIENTEEVIASLELLAAKAPEKYGEDENLFIAVGDGNHSLASAKSVWEEIKAKLKEEETENHPARFALAEIVNIHDEGIQFHPIHRVFFINDNERFIKGLKRICQKGSTGYIIHKEEKEPFSLPLNAAEAVDAVQNYADDFIAKYGGSADYVHGEGSVFEICKNKGAVGVLLPSLKKEDFFEYIVNKGSLPRKCFSMGEACEKRYYIEARKLY
jgi:uncharacterized protein (DUF1015 family)